MSFTIQSHIRLNNAGMICFFNKKDKKIGLLSIDHEGIAPQDKNTSIYTFVFPDIIYDPVVQ